MPSRGYCLFPGRLWEVIQERAKRRRIDCPFVFHQGGKKIGDIRKAWHTACRKAGLEGLLIHDLRRCAARNLSRAGVFRSRRHANYRAQNADHVSALPDHR
jgi:integrase